jgi:hypothetical protein
MSGRTATPSLSTPAQKGDGAVMLMPRLLISLALSSFLVACGDKEADTSTPAEDTGEPCDPPVPEECDGLDNDNDGAIDEDFTDTDADGIADCMELTDECDHIDNDGDGEVDEDALDADEDGIADCDDVEDCDCIDNNGDGQVDEDCSYELSVTASGDDLSTVYVDGTAVGSTAGWAAPQTFNLAVSGGSHWIAATAQDRSGVQAGFIAAVKVNNVLSSATGDGTWSASLGTPTASGWSTSTSGMSAETVATCTWGTLSAFTGTGAQWIWPADCAREDLYPKAWFVTEVQICPDVEVCDGEDNDGDGEVDEGYADTDGDSTADCVESEDCDGIDNTGEGMIDEDWGDADGDGIADCRDPEDCDGVDNDGDGKVDEDYADTDGDGIADCLDEEECDGLDNNGDGVIDEGFGDSDEDGICDEADKEECDGKDNDGDGYVDEDWDDTDGDSIVDCMDEEDCDGLDNDGDGKIDEDWTDLDGDGVGDCVPEDCDCEDNDGDGEVDEDCKYTVEIVTTSDDIGDIYLDGAAWGSTAGWSAVDTFSSSIMAGTHHIAAQAEDVHRSYAGFVAAVYIDGIEVSLTGDGTWMGASGLATGTAWTTSTAGLSAENIVSGPWGLPGDLNGTDAEWVWQGGNRPSDADWTSASYFVLEMDVCGTYAPEECDGIDNDRDGEIDEDFTDTDLDGIADCLDEEECGDDLDNDGDGKVDEDCLGDCDAPTTTTVCSITLSTGAVTCTGSNPMTLLSSTSGYTYQLDLRKWKVMIVDAIYSNPTDWALHIGNSPTNDGNSGDGGNWQNDTEAQLFGTGLVVYGSDVVGSGALLSSSTAVASGSDTVQAIVCDSYFSWSSSTYTGDVSGVGVFQIDGDEADTGTSATSGLNDQQLYLGVNRTVGSTSRIGSGTKRITVTFGQ